MKKIILVSCFLVCLMSTVVAQSNSNWNATIYAGYSHPANLLFSYFFQAHKIEGRMAQGLGIGYEKEWKRFNIHAQTGVNSMGFAVHFYEYKKPSSNFPTFTGVNTISEVNHRTIYFDNSIGAGWRINSKATLNLSLHYLLNVYTGVRENVFLLDTVTYPSEWLKVAVKPTTKGESFYNHFAASASFDYPMIKNARIGVRYFLRLQEMTSQFEDISFNIRRSQSFCVSFSYRMPRKSSK